MSQTNTRPVMSESKIQSQGMSFKEWKMKKEQEVLGHVRGGTSNDILSGVKKQVRFNSVSSQAQSLPIIKENAVLSPVYETSRSLPPNMIQNPVERRMELSICEAVLKQQQLEEQQRNLLESQRNARPVFADLYQQGDAMHLLHESQRRQESVPVVTTSVIGQCSCQHHSCVSQKNVQTSPSRTDFHSSVPVSTGTNRLQELRTENLEKQVTTLQEQIFLLQQQMSYILSMQSSSVNVSPVPVHIQQQKISSNPFLSQVTEQEPKKPQMIDSSTQYTIIEPPSSLAQKPQSDKTFFNQVLGQVNQILDNTDESNNNNHIDSRACKFIDSDTSAMSLQERTNPSPKVLHSTSNSPHNKKKPTDKSSVMDSLAAKYLMANDTQESNYRTNTTNNNNFKKSGEQDTIDVSTTCYNYLKKYDLLKNYEEDESGNDVLGQKLLKTRQNKLL